MIIDLTEHFTVLEPEKSFNWTILCCVTRLIFRDIDPLKLGNVRSGSLQALSKTSSFFNALSVHRSCFLIFFQLIVVIKLMRTSSEAADSEVTCR